MTTPGAAAVEPATASSPLHAHAYILPICAESQPGVAMSAGGDGAASLPSLNELVEQERVLATITARRAGQPRVRKAIGPRAANLVREAVSGPSQGRAAPGSELPDALVEMITRSKRGPTWERYSPGWSQWTTFVSARGKTPLPIDPVEFASFLAETGRSDAGYSQTKMRICAAKAFAALGGHSFQDDHPLIKGYRAGARQTKVVVRPKAKPIFASDIPHEHAPGGLPPQDLRPKYGKRPVLASIAMTKAVAGHMRLMSDTGTRYDDTAEAQLGDAYLCQHATLLPIFRSKTKGGGLPAVLPKTEDPHDGYTGLVETVRAGLAKLLLLEPSVLTAISKRFQALNNDPHRTGIEAMQSWPEDVQAQAARLYAVGLPVHRLPIFGRWLYEELHHGSDLSASLTTRQFGRAVKALVQAQGKDPTNVGAHSMRQGKGVEMFHHRTPVKTVMHALRHTSTLSCEPYVLASAKLATVAVTQCELARRGRNPPAGGALGGSGLNTPDADPPPPIGGRTLPPPRAGGPHGPPLPRRGRGRGRGALPEPPSPDRGLTLPADRPLYARVLGRLPGGVGALRPAAPGPADAPV